jgi:hypothetical protein
MEIMANALSNDVCLSEEPLAIEKNTVMEEKEAIPLPLTELIGDSEIPSLYVENTTLPSRDGISTDEVDSALLCAMKDQRERVALLRLEQTMLDFMKEEVRYIEVGGPNNSVVISPNDSTGKPQLPTGRPTSFQRCCLHRLADRFGIVRETTPDGMIRLVKVKDSQIPKKLLIDLEPSEYEDDNDTEVRALTSILSDSSIKGGKQKMKIMKRSSSSLGSSNSLKNSVEKGNSARDRKKLSDKEKAYAEARARIFNESGANTADADLKPNQVMTTSPLPTPPESTSDSPSPLEQQTDSVSSKVTWRNRREEENDPDFQRLAGPSSHYDAYAAPVYGYPYSQGFAYSSTTGPYNGALSYETEVYNYAPPPPPPPSSPYYQINRGRGRGGRLPRNSTRGEGTRRANVNSMDEFPSLS